MHRAHIVLIRAEDYDDAIGEVRFLLDEEETEIVGNFAEHWSDWSSIGTSSRWTFNTLIGDSFSGAHPYAVSLETEREEFQKVLQFFIGMRETSFDADDYTPESYIFNAHDFTGSLIEFQESIADGASDWYAVLVDFHEM